MSKSRKSGGGKGQLNMLDQDMKDKDTVEISEQDKQLADKKSLERKNPIQKKRMPDGTIKEIKQDDRVRLTAQISHKLNERIRDALYWLAGHPEMYTLSRLASEAMEEKLARLAKRYEGRPFVRDGIFIPRVGNIRTGRPTQFTGTPGARKLAGRRSIRRHRRA